MQKTEIEKMVSNVYRCCYGYSQNDQEMHT